MKPLSREQVREVDRIANEEFGVPGVVLMENAGANAARLLCEQSIDGRVLIVCGKGNNGGDGFVIARHLHNRGIDVAIELVGTPHDLVGDAAINFSIARAMNLPIEAVPDGRVAGDSSSTWIVDALLGTGLRNEVRDPFRAAISSINQHPARVFAVDVPSGLDCNTGEPLGVCVRATLTGTFVARKIGFDQPAAGEFLGEVHVLDIGTPQAAIDRARQLS